MSLFTPAWFDWPEVQALVAAMGNALPQFRFVGGAVRDALLNRPVTDIDLATQLSPDQASKLFVDAGLLVIPTGLAHGTITVRLGHKHFEITSLRKDVATDGRHAEVAFTDDWKQDAMRRDFTMNALYLSIAGELTDFFSGVADAQAGQVRFIGDANARIQEDYLRILRFFRFWAHYGKTAPDARALSACARHSAQIETLSRERIQHELLKLLQAPKSYHAFSFMQQTAVLKHALGFELPANTAIRRLEEIAAAFALSLSSMCKFASLLAGAQRSEHSEELAEKLRFSQAQAQQLKALLALAAQLPSHISEAQQKHFIRTKGNDLFIQAAALAWAISRDMIENSHPYTAFFALGQNWQAPAFPLGGDDLKTLGIAPGPMMGHALRDLEEQWEMSHYRLSKDELLALCKK